VAGAGGVILDSDGHKLMEFSWGLGKSTNNNAEALAVYMGMRLITVNSPARLVVIGDSYLIIKRFQMNIKIPTLTLPQSSYASITLRKHLKWLAITMFLGRKTLQRTH
jgi:ribonuclease HI